MKLNAEIKFSNLIMIKVFQYSQFLDQHVDGDNDAVIDDDDDDLENLIAEQCS